MIAGIVLAAGASTRMGENKLLMEIAGESMVRRAVKTAVSAALSPVVVVVGRDAQRVTVELDDLPVTFAANPSHEPATTRSLQVGLDTLDEKVQAAVIMLADMVLVDECMVRQLVDRMHATGKLAVASRYGGVLAPPMVFRRELFDQLRASVVEGPGKDVITRNQHDASFIDWAPDLLVDVDTPSDYRSVVTRLSE